MIGDSGVGKTALVNRMSDNRFAPSHVPTVGSQFVTVSLTVDGNDLVFELWDTAGQEIYRSLVSFYARDAKGAFVVLDITSTASFNGLGEWVVFIRRESPSVKILVFANKSDLASERRINAQDIRNFAEANSVEFFEGSAKTGKNVADAFGRMGELLLTTVKLTADETPNVELEVAETPAGKKCC
jgi:small GTP-binding protein